MYNVFDVADFFLAKASMSPKKLQKIVYYAYAWTLALLNDDESDLQNKLFHNRIEAWVHGPVVPDLYQRYKNYGWSDIPQNSNYSQSTFNSDEVDILNQVWDVYGKYTANELEMISHRESPWINARNGLAAYSSSSNAINDKDIFRFFVEQSSN